MFKAKTSATLLTMLAISAATASSASASWVVAGTTLGEGSKSSLASTAKVNTAMTLKIAAGSSTVKIVCKGPLLHGESPEIIGPTEGKAKSLTFEGCETTEPTKCALENQPTSIKTQPISMLVSGGPSKSAGRLMILPQTKRVVAELPFSSTNTCAFTEIQPLTGDVTLGAPKLQTEESLQAVEGLGSLENDGLAVGGDHAYLEGGKTTLQLASGGKFKFAGNFSIASNPKLIAFGEETTFTVTGLANAKVKSITDFELPAGTFKWNGGEKNLCIKEYAIEQQCSFKAEYEGLLLGLNLLIFTVEDENGQKASAGVIG